MTRRLPQPACSGLSRSETTDLLSRELVRIKLERKNAYSFWAHEVWLDRYTDHETRVDFVAFTPKGGVRHTDGPHVERGTFRFFEVKSCMADLRSGHGPNFEGDENFLVMPVEMFGPFKEEVVGNERGYVATACANATCLLYGIGANGKPGFFETGEYVAPDWTRSRSAAELLMCMMRAMIANSGDSCVDHRISKMREDALEG